GEGNADGATDCGHDGCFDHKLQQYVAASRAQGLADADFARAFRDGCEHHVHDHHATDHQKNRNYAHHGCGDHSGKIFPEIHEGGGIEDAEVVFLIGRQMAAGAHEGARFVLGAFHPFGTAGLYVDPDAVVRAIDFEV